MRNANGLHIKVYPGGVKNLLLLKKDKLIVGTGDGTVELIEIRKDSKLNANKTNKSLTIPAIVAVSIHTFLTNMYIIFSCVYVCTICKIKI